jgi:dipeptidyl aminopeptidase/acylaminoacyl peptidase
VNERRLKRMILATAPPDEIGAQRRGWRITRAAFAEREPTPWPMRHRRLLTAGAVGAALLLAAVSPPGRAVIGRVRDAVGTEKVVVGAPAAQQARPGPIRLPTEGRVLVAAPSGVWFVSAQGTRRRVGTYEEATWSPGGRLVGASRRHQLAAVTPRGQVRWTLARPRTHSPRWSPSGSRIAYLSGGNLRVVAADRNGDTRIDAAANVAPAWRPGDENVLAYSDSDGTVTVVSTDDRVTRWTAAGSAASPAQLDWSADGERLLVVRHLDGGRLALVVFDGDGQRLQYLELPGVPIEAAFSPNDHRIALVRRVGTRSELLVIESDTLRRQTVVFSGQGRFSDVAWSPGGGWLLLGWQSADQWLFIRSADVSKISAISSLAVQFDPRGASGGAFPRVEGWCCPRG